MFRFLFYDITGKGIPTRHVLGKSKMILGLLEGVTTMKKGEVAMVLFVMYYLLLIIDIFRDVGKTVIFFELLVMSNMPNCLNIQIILTLRFSILK